MNTVVFYYGHNREVDTVKGIVTAGLGLDGPGPVDEFSVKGDKDATQFLTGEEQGVIEVLYGIRSTVDKRVLGTGEDDRLVQMFEKITQR